MTSPLTRAGTRKRVALVATALLLLATSPPSVRSAQPVAAELAKDAPAPCPSAPRVASQAPWSTERIGFVVRKARLEAELDARDDLRLPPEVKAESAGRAVDKTLRDERLALETRTQTFRAQIDEMERSKRLASNEIKYAETKHEVLERHILALQNALEMLNGLAAKGQAPISERLNMAQRIVDYELTRTDLELAVARSREDISRAERNLADARTQHRHEILADLNDTQSRLADVMDQESAAVAAAEAQARCTPTN